MIPRGAVNHGDIRRELVLHHRIGGHDVTAKPDVTFAQTEQRIVIPRRRAENKYVASRAAPQEGDTLMAGVYRLHHRRSLPNLRLPERISTPTGSNRFCQRLQRGAFRLQHLYAW